MTGVAKHTVLELLKDVGCAAAEYHNAHVRNLRVRRIQADEIWASVYGKDKYLTLEQVQALGLAAFGHGQPLMLTPNSSCLTCWGSWSLYSAEFHA